MIYFNANADPVSGGLSPLDRRFRLTSRARVVWGCDGQRCA